MNKIEAIKQAETFDAKADLFGISLQERCDMLNKLYKDRLHFAVYKGIFNDEEPGIRVKILDVDVDILELPAIHNLHDELFEYPEQACRNLTSVKLPKTLEKLTNRAVGHLACLPLNTLWMWDTTEFDYEDLWKIHSLERVIIQSSTGKKPYIHTMM